MPRLSGQLLGDLQEALRREMVDARDTVGHIALVEVLQKTTVVQEQIVLRIRLLTAAR